MDYSNNYSNTGSNSPARRSTPSPDADQISAAPSQRSVPSQPKNPFLSPFSTRPSSFRGSTALEFNQQALSQRYFHSRRVKKGQVERPWMEKKDPREKWTWIIPLCGIFLGLAIAGFLVWDGLRSVVNHTYCPVLMEDWSNGFNEAVWTKESEVGGFG